MAKEPMIMGFASLDVLSLDDPRTLMSGGASGEGASHD